MIKMGLGATRGLKDLKGAMGYISHISYISYISNSLSVISLIVRVYSCCLVDLRFSGFDVSELFQS